ncbi:unnamed protein product [Rotaria sp. Silwood1]|nr:unnamed protein product [Rotaria sp. Silwood1]
MRTHPINDEEITSETNDTIENSSLTNDENNFSNEDNPFHLLESRWIFGTCAEQAHHQYFYTPRQNRKKISG